ncbi:MAG: hypothetical protein JXN61_02795 [Sedimentisphaerales bacterium]|nr:hypothetical protein [Sedimentisphaerales bacterium]
MFEEKFLKELPQDSAEAGKIVCDLFFDWHARMDQKQMLKNFDKYVRALAFGHVFVEAYDLPRTGHTIDYKAGATTGNINSVVSFFQASKYHVNEVLTHRATSKAFEEAKQRYGAAIGKAVIYQFSDSDFERVQDLINEMRDLLTKSTDFEEDHKLRLLKRLKKLQAELHKKMSNLDSLWGLIGDAGVALGKFGENVRPLTDRIGEILRIVSRTQAKAEDIQKGLPLRLLEDGDKEN